jgi:hypothetical protein
MSSIFLATYTHSLTHSLTPHSTVLLEKLTSLCSQARNSPHFMEPEDSLPYSQCPPPIPLLSRLFPFPTTHFNFLKFHLTIILQPTSGSPQWPLSPWFPHQHPVHNSLLPIRATCPAHLILLDFTTRTILGKE